MNNNQTKNILSEKGYNKACVFALLALFVTFGIWSIFAPITGSVSAMGEFTTQSGGHVVQSRVNGVVTEIYVQENEFVKRGQKLLQLDTELLENRIRDTEIKRFELLIQINRLRAELDGDSSIQFESELQTAAESDAKLGRQLSLQKLIFETALSVRRSQVELYEQKYQSLDDSIRGSLSKIDNLVDRISENEHDKLALESLSKKNLATRGQLTAINNLLSSLNHDLLSEQNTLDNLKDQKEQIVLDKQVYLLQIKDEGQKLLSSNLAELNSIEGELSELKIQMDQATIFAPVDGNVFQIATKSTPQGVSASENLMYVMARDEPRIIKSKIRPQHRLEIYLGQEADILVDGLSSHGAIELTGYIRKITADAIPEADLRSKYYEVEIAVAGGKDLARDLYLMRPGVPVQVHFRTSTRTPFEYFSEPLTKFRKNALN